MRRKDFLLFGYPKIELDGAPIDIKSRKGLAILAYLAVTRQPQSRDVLATLLWPEYDQTRARTNLRRTIFNLNRTPVSDWLKADTDTIALRTDLLPCVDVVRFETQLANGRISSLQKAVGHYRDDFLIGYYLPDSTPFDEWAAGQRARLQRAVLQILETLTDHYLEEGRAQQAITTSRRQLEIDDLREQAWRQLMTALTANGQRNEALTAYATCCQTLQGELGVDPEEKTTELWAAIRSGQSTNWISKDTQDFAGESGPPVAMQEDEHGKPAGPALHTSGVTVTDNAHQLASPYRGLLAFREEDAPYFFGREEFTELLVRKVQEQSIVAVIGPSGSGKTSVVYAGLVAQLRQTPEWLITSFRPGTRPFHALAAAFVPLLDPQMGMTEQLVESGRLASALQQADLTLYDVVERGLQIHPDAKRLLLIADQFEELYTLCSDAELRRFFLDTLLELVFAEQYQPAPRFTLVLTLRADFLGQALTHRALADAIQEFDVKLGPMSRPELSRAIANPAQMQQVGFESGLVARILDDVGDEPGNLPLLEFSLASLWQQRTNGQIVHNVYEAIGRVDGALSRYADRVFEQLDKDEQEVARRIFIQLVRPGEGTEDTRRIALRSDLGNDAWALISHLADARLVVTGRNASGHDTVEVVHEALIRSWGQLRTWLESDREFRVWQERLRAGLRQWEETAQNEGALLRGLPLAIAENWLTQYGSDLSQNEKRFIQASLTHRTHEEQKQEAQRERELEMARKLAAERNIAVSRRLAIESAKELDRANTDLALLLAVEAINTSETREAWTILRQALIHPRSLLFTLSGHEKGANMAIWNDDESRILTADFDGTARVWDAESGAELLTLTGHTRQLTYAVWSRDERCVLTASSDGAVRVWDAQSGDEHVTLTAASSTGATKAAWSPDESRILTVSHDGMGAIWDAQTGQNLLTLSVHSSVIQEARWNRDGSRVITNGAEHTARIWDAHTGEALLVLAGHMDGVACARWSKNEALILTASADGTAKLWDAATGAEIVTLAGHSRYLWDAKWNRDESRILTVSGDCTARIWDAVTGEMLVTFSGHAERVRQAVWNRNERLIATASEDHTARVWNAQTGQELAVFGAPGPVRSVQWSADGSRILTAGGAGTARVWTWGGHQEPLFELPSLDGGPSTFEEAEWNQDESLILTASNDPSGFARVWEAKSGELRLTVSGHTRRVWHVVWSQDESRILTASADGTARVWDGRNGKELLSLQGHTDQVWWANWNADETCILTASSDGTAKLWNAITGAELNTLLMPDKVGLADWLPSKNDIILQSNDGTLRVWDATGMERFSFRHPDANGSIWSNADGSRIYTGGGDTAKVWDGATGDDLLTVEHDAAVTSVVCNIDSSRILTGSRDGTARVWDATTGEELLRLSGHEHVVYHAEWNEAEDRIMTTGNDGTVRIWDARTGEELMIIEDKRGHGISAWSADGRRVLVVGVEGVRQYFTHKEDVIAVACKRLFRNLTQAEWRQFMGNEPYRATCPNLRIPDAT